LRRPLLLASALLVAAGATAQERHATIRDPVRLVAMGDRMERQGDPLAATVFYERALDFSPAYAPALRAAGANALRRGDVAAASRHYAAWANAEPRNPDALIGLASSLVLERRPREALALLGRAADLGGDKGRISAERGIALDLEGDTAGAQAAYAAALETAPSDPVVTQRMALSLALAGQNGAAVTLLQRFGAEPEAAEVRRTLALVHALGGRFEDAAGIAASLMPLDEARRMQAFYAQLPRLNPRDRALAVHFGKSPGTLPPPAAPVQVATAAALVAAPAATAVAAMPTAPSPRPLSPQLLKARPRVWVQLVSMADAAKLPSEWRRIRGTAGVAAEGQLAYVQRAGAVHRLLVGPFAGEWAARRMIASLRAKRVPAVLNRTPAGADVVALEEGSVG